MQSDISTFPMTVYNIKTINILRLFADYEMNAQCLYLLNNILHKNYYSDLFCLHNYKVILDQKWLFYSTMNDKICRLRVAIELFLDKKVFSMLCCQVLRGK